MKVIGGMFGLDAIGPEPIGSWPHLSNPHCLLATARSAFALLHRSLNPPQVWLPSYLCDVVLGAFPTTSQVRFYAVDQHLRCHDDAWLRQIRAGDLVVFIDYFGLTFWEQAGAEARRRGAWIVEDACHAFLNESFSELSHFVVVSPRKFVGVPDGGILLTRAKDVALDCDLPGAPVEWWLTALAASQLRAEFDRHGGDRKWFRLFQRAELDAPTDPRRMSELTEMLLMGHMDYGTMAASRRENYGFLSAEFQDIGMLTTLTPGAVPIGFPVRLRNRDAVRRTLFTADIYPPVHWSIAETVPSEFGDSHRLSTEIMTLPCDQRYDLADMERMARYLRAAKPERVF